MTRLEKLQADIAEFCKERDWDQFHNNKDLCIGLVTEAAEVLDLLRFKTPEQCAGRITVSDAFRDELGDVMFFLLRIAERNGLDLIECTTDKLDKTRIKYPIEIAKGSNQKYTEFK